MFYTIYEVTHVPSGKKYIGKHQTNDLDDDYMGSGKMIRRAIKKYGLDEFQKKILHVFDSEEEMNVKEAELVTEEFCRSDDTYNLCPGGHGGWGYINLNGLTNYEKAGKNGGFSNRDKLSDISLDKIRRGNVKGSNSSGFSNANKKRAKGLLENGFKNKNHSDEWKKNHSKLMKNQPILTCRHCNVQTRNKGNYNRWHGDNCRIVSG